MTVRDITEADFERDVLARSAQVPVVVDFWAPWCAPCRALGPTLEREVSALGGRVELAKLNVDQAQALAGRFEVQGIPAVKAFRDGKVVAEFVGAQGASYIKQWLAELAPSEAVLRLEAAKTIEQLQPLLADPEVGPQATLAMAELQLAAGQVDAALATLSNVQSRGPLAARADALRQQADFVRAAREGGDEDTARARVAANPEDLDARFSLGSALVAKGDDAGALGEFLAIVSRSRKFRDDGARRAMVMLFERLGPTHELTRDFRRRLQVYL